ncbi:hypothetical protein K1I48_23455 [Bacillus licheniformis]|jgi:hypothetical protein|uniref:hypothetical protein n=1 Tax=Bacillus subtilis group TaxID=653685 RepID=UPI001C6443B1|nr:hypothetical protein [Bacillus licheniformis]MBW7636381.1 hypothetical protein [Bacillus licheniformis]MED4507185.1 hypothetical protein [Bacillus licheniformis]
MEKTFEVELTVTQRFNTRVKVSGDFKDKNDPEIEKAAKIEADRMDHNHWGYDDTEFEVDNVFEIKP